MAKQENKFIAIRDTREKKDTWFFEKDKYCDGTIDQALKVGDYSVVGLEDKFTIERKRRTSELANNLFEPRFQREIEKLAKFKHKFIVCQFDLDVLMKYPLHSGIPYKFHNSTTVSGAYLLAKLINFQVKYDIPIILAGNQSHIVAKTIMRQVARYEKLI